VQTTIKQLDRNSLEDEIRESYKIGADGEVMVNPNQSLPKSNLTSILQKKKLERIYGSSKLKNRSKAY